MREPATSCTTCGAALLPAEVLYTRQADVVCAACFGESSGAGPAPVRSSWGRGGGAAVRTAHERRGSILRWSLLFAILAASTLQVRHFALIRLQMICPRVSIDAPTPGAAVKRTLIVRGHVAGHTATRPLWVVARIVDGHERCAPDVPPAPVISDPFGFFAVALELPGRRGQRYAISVVSVDQAVEGVPPLQTGLRCVHARLRDSLQQGGRGRRCGREGVDHRGLPLGAVVVASVGVVLGDDPPPSFVAPSGPRAFPMLNYGDVLDADRY